MKTYKKKIILSTLCLFIFASSFSQIEEFPDEKSIKGYKMLHDFKPDKANGIKITVRPNPAGEWTAFDYQLPDNMSKGMIKITDVYGKIIETIAISGNRGQRIWDTKNVKPSIYFYNLNVPGYSKSGKIIISGNYRNK